MKISTRISLCSILILASGCASSTYRVQSTPADSDVEVQYRNGSRRVLGKTPATFAASDVNAAKEALSFTLKKEGYESQTIYVPGSLTEKSVDINVALTKNAVSGDPKKFDETLNALASAVADVQKDIQKKDYSFAEQKLTNLITEYPNVSTLYSLLGNISYLERRIEKALVYYKKAQSLSPNSVELQKIVERLEGISSGGTK